MRTMRTVLLTLAFSTLGACNLYFGDHTSNSTGYDAPLPTPDGNGEPPHCGDAGFPVPPDAGGGIEPDAAQGGTPDAWIEYPDAPYGTPPDAGGGGGYDDAGCGSGTPDAGPGWDPDAGTGGGGGGGYPDAGCC